MNRFSASFFQAVRVFAWTACVLAPTVVAHAAQQSNGSGNATIVGVVVDENHQPVSRSRVLAFSAKDPRQTSAEVQGLVRPSGSTSTDTTGTFRISGLAAGDYLVAAEAMPTFPNGGQIPARMWAPTFYPSTVDASKATAVTASAQTNASVTIELVPVTPVPVRGTVTTESGRSAEGFDVGLFHSFGGFGGGGTVAVVGAKGVFEAPRVPPGRYELTIEPHASQPGEEGHEFVHQVIEVRDREVNLSLTAGPGASITGHVVAEPASAVTTPIGLRVTAAPRGTDGPSFAGRLIASPVNGDWSFRLTGLSGSYDLFASSDRAPAVIATRVLVDGTSYPDGKGVAVARGHHDVVVYVTPRATPKPPVEMNVTPAQLVTQFRGEKVFWTQFEVGKAIVEKHDASVLPALTDWLQHTDRHIRGNVAFIFASFGDPRGLQTIADILNDRTERPEGQGIPGASSDGRYHFEAQVASDRYYAAHLLGDLKDPRGVELLVPLLDDPQTQFIVPWSLGQIGGKRAISALIAALDKDDPSMRVYVIYALEALHAKEAVPRLLTLVNDNRKSRLGSLVTVSEAAKAAIARLQ
jgi:HEAT repeats